MPAITRDKIRNATPLATRLMRDWFTDATGRGYSIGRALGVFIVMLFCCFPIGIAIFMGVQTGSKPSMQDWVQLLNSLTTYVPAICVGAGALILGTAPTDPGGAWWSHANAPPSTNTTTTEVDPTPPAPSTTTTQTHTPAAADPAPATPDQPPSP